MAAGSDNTAEIRKQIALLGDSDPGKRERAAGALWDLAFNNSESRDEIRIKGGILPLVELLSDSKPEVREYAAGALRNLAISSANHSPIGYAGGVESLIGLLSDEKPKVRQYAAEALFFLLAFVAVNTRSERQEGLLP